MKSCCVSVVVYCLKRNRKLSLEINMWLQKKKIHTSLFAHFLSSAKEMTLSVCWLKFVQISPKVCWQNNKYFFNSDGVLWSNAWWELNCLDFLPFKFVMPLLCFWRMKWFIWWVFSFFSFRLALLQWEQKPEHLFLKSTCWKKYVQDQHCSQHSSCNKSLVFSRCFTLNSFITVSEMFRLAMSAFLFQFSGLDRLRWEGQQVSRDLWGHPSVH